MTGHTPGPWEREAKLQMAEVERLMDINTDLLAALKDCLNPHVTVEASRKRAHAAIAKAEGKTDD